MRSFAAAALLAAAGLAVAAAAPAPPDAHGFSLAVLRRDGLMVPFASFDGRRWSAPWPDSTFDVARPISIGDIPPKWWGAAGPGASWTAVAVDAPKRPLKLARPITVRVFCTVRFAAVTDYRGGPFDPRDPTVPTDALAVAGDVAIEPITPVSVHAPDARAMITLITSDFNREETRASNRFTDWKHPFSREERAGFPIELESFYRARESSARGAWRTSYVEAIRKFPPGPSEGDCGLITWVHGWVSEREGKPAVINLGARVAYCDRSDVSFMQPLGRLHAAGEVYWVYRMSSWRDEFYSVARVRPDDVRPVVAVAGGECPRGMR